MRDGIHTSGLYRQILNVNPGIFTCHELLECTVKWYHHALSHVGQVWLSDTMSLTFYNPQLHKFVEAVVAPGAHCQRYFPMSHLDNGDDLSNMLDDVAQAFSDSQPLTVVALWKKFNQNLIQDSPNLILISQKMIIMRHLMSLHQLVWPPPRRYIIDT
jgi:hypothetical protein